MIVAFRTSTACTPGLESSPSFFTLSRYSSFPFINVAMFAVAIHGLLTVSLCSSIGRSVVVSLISVLLFHAFDRDLLAIASLYQTEH